MWHAFSNAMLRVGNRAGTSSIEFALVALIFLFLLVAISDIARYLFMVQSMQLLATQTARATIVPFGTPNYLGLAPGCVSVGSAGLPFGLPAFLDPATTQLCMAPTDDPRSNANVVTITVEAPFTAFTPGLSALTTGGNALVTVVAQLQYPKY
jgi:hypothetical protein